MARILCKNTKCSLGSVLYSVQWGSDLFPLVTSVFIAGSPFSIAAVHTNCVCANDVHFM